MVTKSFDIHENDVQLDDLLSLSKQGIEVILTDGPTPLARLVPLNDSTRTRVPGLHAHLGTAWVSDDFDEPLPDGFWIGTDEATTA